MEKSVNYIIREYNLSKMDILKVGHHGSSTPTDPDFLEAIDANTALIPVGDNNRYGHPNQEVIETLENSGLQIFRTDQHGAVQFEYTHDQALFQIFIRNNLK